MGFFGGEVAVGIGVLSKGDLDAVRGREVRREGQLHAGSEAGPIRDGDIHRAFGVRIGAWGWCRQGLLDGIRGKHECEQEGECADLERFNCHLFSFRVLNGGENCFTSHN